MTSDLRIEFCLALVETSQIIFFPLAKLYVKFEAILCVFYLCCTVAPVSDTVGMPLAMSCVFPLNFCRQLGSFLSSSLVYSINTGLNITCYAVFYCSVGLR
jgi:hypothetical protein